MHTFLMWSALAVSAQPSAGAAPPAPAAARSIVVRSPQALPDDRRLTVFLAGSIDMGGSADWQAQVARELADEGVVLLNPRREDWNPAWTPGADQPEFRRQVEWELAALQRADVIAMYFAPGSQSPVTLLELGLHAGSGKLLVACPDGFWRKGNVDITATRYGVEQVSTIEELTRVVRRRIGAVNKALPAAN